MEPNFSASGTQHTPSEQFNRHSPPSAIAKENALPPARRAHASAEPPPRTPDGLARGLGWFSIGLGVAQIVAPRALARLIGMQPDARTTLTMRALGAREITAGLGILSKKKPAMFLWSRVAGDAMDLALLGNAMTDEDNDRGALIAATLAVAGVTALDVVAAQKHSTTFDDTERDRVHTTQSITVNRSVEEVAELWKDYLSSHSPGLDVDALSGVVRCMPAAGLTRAEVHVEHGPGMGMRVEAQLRRFKQWAELGEIVHSDASIHRGPHPAQPSARSMEKGANR